MAWSEETLGDASKKELVQFLQKWCTAEFLKQHKLNGQEKAIVKKAKLPALRQAYTAAMTMPKEHMTSEGYDEVRAMVFGQAERVADGGALEEARDAIGDRLAKLGFTDEATPIPDSARGAAPPDYAGPFLDEMPSSVLARIMVHLGSGASVRPAFAAASPKLRAEVLRAAPLAWRELDFLDEPHRAATLTNRSLTAIAALSGGELRRVDLTGCFSLSRGSINKIAKSNRHLEEILVRFETSWQPNDTLEFTQALTQQCPSLRLLAVDLTAPQPTPALLTLLDPAVSKTNAPPNLQIVPPN
jgi:hypothetical protein